MVEAVWHGVFMVLGWSVNGRLVRQQYAPNHSSSPGIFSDFLSGLNHGAIQFANKERPECINVTLLCFHSLWPGDFGKSLAGYSLPHFAELKEQFSQKLKKIQSLSIQPTCWSKGRWSFLLHKTSSGASQRNSMAVFSNWSRWGTFFLNME